LKPKCEELLSVFAFKFNLRRYMTEAARAGKLDPVIGRDDEIRRTIQILSRRSKNNPAGAYTRPFFSST
jgi:hypothetical protein